MRTILLLLLANSALANFSSVEVLSVYDGDTFRVNIPNAHPLIGENIGIRIRNVDTAELRTKDPCEKKAAVEAKNMAHARLSGASRIELRNVSRGKYFRIVADVYYDGKSLGAELIEAGLAYAYDGGTKPEIDWCVKD